MVMMVKLGLVIVVLSIQITLSKAAVSCRDFKGNSVDWYYIYKLPIITDTTNKIVRKGEGFYYLDKNKPSFQLSNESVKSLEQPIAQTLNQIYKRKLNQVAYLMYNDQPSETGQSTGREYGHTKGIVAFDSSTGFWLTHSVPKFPPTKKYDWAESYSNGQSMLCITFKTGDMNEIATQLMYQFPNVFSYKLPSGVLKFARTFKKVAECKGERAYGRREVKLISREGQVFTNFVKSAPNGNDGPTDIYVDQLAKTLEADLQVQTWRTGRVVVQKSHCPPHFKVENINAIKFPVGVFKSTKDHSKFAITKHPPWICIGDLNRVESQLLRGGGITCASIPPVWRAYNIVISDVESCPPRKQHVDL